MFALILIKQGTWNLGTITQLSRPVLKIILDRNGFTSTVVSYHQDLLQ